MEAIKKKNRIELPKATKTKNPTEGNNIFVYLVIILGALIFIAPLIHIEFPKEQLAITEYRYSLDEKITFLDNKISLLRDKYDTGQISAEEFIMSNDELQLEKVEQIKNNKIALNSRIDQERIFGWKTPRIFLIGFGIRLPYLLFSLIISYLILKNRTRKKNLARAYFFLQSMCYSISLYVLVWCFWYSEDYPLSTYRYTAIVLCSMAALLITYSIRYYRSKTSRLRSKLFSMIDFFVEIRNVHYKNLLKVAIKKDLHDETYQEAIKENTKQFEKRMHGKVEEIFE